MKTVQIGSVTFKLMNRGGLPPLGPSEYEALKQSIRQGVRVPVVVDEDYCTIDGDHRLMAAEDTGQSQVPFAIVPGLDEEAKVRLALDLNLHRRHLTAEQRQELATRWRQAGESYRQIADRLGVSHETARRDVERSTVTDVTVELPEKVRGKDGRQRAARRQTVITAHGAAEAQRVIEACRSVPSDAFPAKMITARRATRLAREAKADERGRLPARDVGVGTADLWIGDFRERGSEIADQSVDLIFTDPPYSEEHLPLWTDLGVLATRVLKPGGILVAYSGQQYLPQVYASLDKHLTYFWTCISRNVGGDSVRWDKGFRNGWKPLLVYRKPPLEVCWDPFADVVSGGKEKDAHDWQQSVSEAEYFIGPLCPPGGLVLDPMIGSGTTAIAAIGLGRKCIGIELDPAAIESARERLSAAVAKVPTSSEQGV